ncbi:MAG: hypothetical protein ABI683_09585 [Ginsengibacter sp.]
MKKTINNTKITVTESLKRILYAFQVLIVGIAIPVLFFMGVSTKADQRREKETEMSVSTHDSKLTAQTTLGIPIIIEI